VSTIEELVIIFEVEEGWVAVDVESIVDVEDGTEVDVELISNVVVVEVITAT